MNSNHTHRYVLPTCALLAMFIAGGCGTTATSRFYILRPIPEAASAGSGTSAGSVTVGLGPVDIPTYLERPQIAVVGEGNQVIYAEYDRWAGKLDDQILDVLEKNVAALLAPEWIVKFPGADVDQIDFWVVIHILRLEGEMGGDVDLFARWIILKKTTSTVLSTGAGTYTETTAEDGYPAVVSALSLLFGHLSRDLAVDIERISNASEGDAAASTEQ